MDDVAAPTSPVTGLSLGDRVDEVIDRTTSVIDEFWARASDDLAIYPSEAVELAAMLERMTRGKLLLSRLAVATYLGLGGDSADVSDALSAGVQLIHVGLCVHDDLIYPRAQRERRGRGGWRSGVVHGDQPPLATQRCVTQNRSSMTHSGICLRVAESPLHTLSNGPSGRPTHRN